MGKAKPKSHVEALTGNDGWIGDRYRLLDKLGEGGFGLVYRAEQVKPLHRLVAIKLLKAGVTSADILGRFAIEKQTLAIMEHPNIAAVFDAGELPDGRTYFVMEVVSGAAVTLWCQERDMPVRERLEIFVQACMAVQHAHQRGILHRDLKPSNVMVVEVDGRRFLLGAAGNTVNVLAELDASSADEPVPAPAVVTVPVEPAVAPAPMAAPIAAMPAAITTTSSPVGPTAVGPLERLKSMTVRTPVPARRALRSEL
jgi:serine/threonine protein kinase